MTKASLGRLSPFSDPDEILDALYELEEPDSESRDALVALLKHEDPDIRAEVVRILIRRWKDEEARPLALELLREDNDEEVREAAAYAITGTTSAATRDHDITALVTVLRDESELSRVRSAAYDALLIAHHKADFPTMQRAFTHGGQ